MQGLSTSIIGKAKENGLISIEAINIRDFSENKHKKVDDYPYGGGAGMLMQAQPVYDAWKSVADKIGKKPRETNCSDPIQILESGEKETRYAKTTEVPSVTNPHFPTSFKFSKSGASNLMERDAK